MAECTYHDLRKARDARKLPRWEVANAVGVSEDTIERWETGKVQPDPEDVDRFAEAVGASGLWHRWMLSHYDSYRKRYRDAVNYALPVAFANLRHQMNDVLNIYDPVERDALDGRIDDPELRACIEKEVQDIQSAATAFLQALVE